MEVDIVELTPDNAAKLGLCGYKNPKKEGFPEKLEWIKNNLPRGLKILAAVTPDCGTQGMIEFIPGEYCCRPVKADRYMFIHCLFTGFKAVYKNRGLAQMLLDRCISDARSKGMIGLAVVTRKGPFMAGSPIFLKNGFQPVDEAEPDFELLALKFDKHAPAPSFRPELKDNAARYSDGLYILRSSQCPYTVKNVNEMKHTAKELFGIDAAVIDMVNPAIEGVCAFGSFGIVRNSKVLARHPISNTRFVNIMKSVIK